jgi:5-formyltetrahydrofolate cyclo-ligase
MTADVAAKSSAILARLAAIPPFEPARNANRLMSYLNFGNEVVTQPLLLMGSLIIPYCSSGEIVPICVHSFGELMPSQFGILEPKPSIREDACRQVPAEAIDCVLVPGLAFDSDGNRLGRGKGYYDRFLLQLPAETITIGLAFESQIVDSVPTDTWDKPVKIIITENRVITVGRR